MSSNDVNPHSFQDKVARANPNLICTAKADAVRVITVKDLLQIRLRIPIFQRRYCWSREQWRTLLGDVSRVAKGLNSTHALGRITCAVKPDIPHEALVIDGQQRHTTCVLLLASLRDVMLQRNPSEPMIDEINRLLFPDSKALASWATARMANSLAIEDTILVDDGEDLSFAAVVPTYCDRVSFYIATLPPDLAPAGISGTQASTHSSSSNGTSSEKGICDKSDKKSGAILAWRRPSEAKAYFLQELQARNDEELRALTAALLGGLQWLFFPITMSSSSNSNDGTEDLAVIFERLAQRDATCCRPHRRSEYADMGAADFVRNLVLGSFTDEATSISVYKRSWLPLEQAAALAADSTGSSTNGNKRSTKEGGVAAVLEAFLEAFLAEQGPPKLGKTTHDASSKQYGMPTYVGGQLYARFRAWFECAINDDSASTACESSTTLAIDNVLLAPGDTVCDGVSSGNKKDVVVENHLQKLFDFAQTYFAAKREDQSNMQCSKSKVEQPRKDVQAVEPSGQALSTSLVHRGDKLMNPPTPKQRRTLPELPRSQEVDEQPLLQAVKET